MDREILVTARFVRSMRAPIHALAADDWQMAPGERAAVEGLLAQIRPALAIEIGTAQGGSLRRIAEYSDEVHAFDLAPEVDSSAFPNVTFHVGDSHELLPQVLADLADQGRNVDFALVDGDHRPAGARQDLETLLGSPALRQSTIVMHDTMNEGVRAAFERIDWAARGNVSYVDLAFVQLDQTRILLGERWGGLGLVLIDEDGTSGCRTGVVPRRTPVAASAAEIGWRLATPLRAVARAIGRRLRDALARRRR
jgi:predicted O-methyltransferase YrrM